LLSFEDIGERVQAQQTLNRVQADFAHAARISMLGELTASIAHEVNQPLGAIVANGQAGLRWLQREVPDIEHALESTTDMIADARRASDIIGRIRAMAVNRTPKRERLNFDLLVREVMLFLGHEMQTNGVRPTLALELGDTFSLLDRTQIQQVIANLCVNSIQAMAHDAAAQRQLLVTTRLVSPVLLQCSVEDSGPGIQEPNLPRLFDTFYTTKDNGRWGCRSADRSSRPTAVRLVPTTIPPSVAPDLPLPCRLARERLTRSGSDDPLPLREP
jgi:C4-dicarboxylate-specific signal transduction histidine kinase